MPLNLLIVKLSSMGDVIHTLPAARHLREAFPDARLAWAVQDIHADLLDRQPWLDRVIAWRRKNLKTFREFIVQLRKTRWDVAVDFQGIFRSGMVTRLSGAKQRVGYGPSKELAHWFYNLTIPRIPREGHAVEWYLHLASEFTGLPAEPPLDRPYLHSAANSAAIVDAGHPSRFPLHLRESDRQTAADWLAAHNFDAFSDRLILLCPDCRRPCNRWPEEKFSKLAQRLLAVDGLRVALVGGPLSRELCDRIAGSVKGNLWRADGKMTLSASAALIERASVTVTGDSGPMHLAAAVGSPIVALFGPTNPAWTGPYSRQAIVLSRHLECSPCKTRGPCPLKHVIPRCMNEIRVEEVYCAIHRQLQAVASRPHP